MKLSPASRPQVLAAPPSRSAPAPGHLAHRPVRRATPPRRRGLHWLAMRSAMVRLFRRNTHAGPFPTDSEFGYQPQHAPHHAAGVLNRMAGARLRPDHILHSLYLAAGNAGTPRQKNFDLQFDAAIKESLSTLGETDLYRLHSRLRGPMKNYAAALRTSRNPDVPAAISRGMGRTADRLVRLEAAVVQELRNRGYNVPLKEHAAVTPTPSARRAVKSLLSFAAQRHAAGEGVFPPEHKDTIARGLKDIIRTDTSDEPVPGPDGAPLPVSRQFIIDLPRQDVILQNSTDPDDNLWDSVRNEPNAARRNDNVSKKLIAQCNGNTEQALALSLLLTQATTKDPYTFTALNRSGHPGVVSAPFFSRDNALLGQTHTAFTVRPADGDGAVDVLMECRLQPDNAQIDSDVIPLDARQSVVEFSLAFRLPPAGPPSLQDARYRYSISA